ncbi:MAG TPA: TIGR00730 family Rossman fold protein [bacterium]|nr:TIGR00730 family Rossman fold protein [bacterium]
MQRYEINELKKEEAWRLFRIIGEIVEGFDVLPAFLPAVTIFGSSRMPEGHPYYQLAYRLAQALAQKGYSVITGGGPGVMEGANRAALEAHVPSIGLSIDLPRTQMANQYTTLALRFQHFFVRKLMLVKYSSAFFLLPGGYGSLDELFETLTLMQTQKIRPFPMVLLGRDYWAGLLDWLRSTVVNQGMVYAEDLNLMTVTDSIEEAVALVEDHRRRQEAEPPA